MSEMKFSQMMARLEEIVAKLESGDVSLEESLTLFEEGSALAKECTKRLSDAELKIRQLSEFESEQENSVE